MIQSTTQIVLPVADPQPLKIKLVTLFTILFECVGNVLTLASTAIRGALIAPIRLLWAQYYERVVFEGEGVAMPHSAIGFIISALLSLAEIKSQNLPGFPFQTHPQSIMVSVTSLLIYGLASAAELIVSCAGLDPASVYALTAHLGKIISLCILMASLASMFYL